jgi:hypothetical protein
MSFGRAEFSGTVGKRHWPVPGLAGLADPRPDTPALSEHGRGQLHAPPTFSSSRRVNSAMMISFADTRLRTASRIIRARRDLSGGYFRTLNHSIRRVITPQR